MQLMHLVYCTAINRKLLAAINAQIRNSLECKNNFLFFYRCRYRVKYTVAANPRTNRTDFAVVFFAKDAKIYA